MFTVWFYGNGLTFEFHSIGGAIAFARRFNVGGFSIMRMDKIIIAQSK